ncbi:MAG TPA: heme o synthase [Candidatus Eisenbacteria bacterium]|nr:heme o synthase [Candidatus Eisenbacteria bacterium]
MLDYIQLTKPRIVLLVIVTAVAGLVVEGSLLHHPGRFAAVLFAITMTAGSANAFNQYFERDLDATMDRTRLKRPLPRHRVPERGALAFAIGVGAASVVLLALTANALSAVLALATIVFYGFYYTLWLKPRTVHNIVIGGAAGAMGPVIAWAAASGTIALPPVLMFLVIFLWTPPHFWALALCLQDDYRKTGIPMLPVVKGEAETYRQIELYTIGLVGLTLAMPFLNSGGAIFGAAALLLGGVFLWKSWTAKRAMTTRSAWQVFGYSILYLFVLFVAIIVDAVWHIPLHA